jgi:DNA-binding transcriptional LysR family regulator
MSTENKYPSMRSLTLQLGKFKIFADLVETKSFIETAKLNGITQASVSLQLRLMERHFKTLLIDRSQKRFHMTSEGMLVYDGGKEILYQYEKLLCNLKEMNKIISGTIRISTIPTIGLHVLPPYIKKLTQDYPSMKVQVEYRRVDFVYEDILHNSADFGLVDFPVKMNQIEMIPFRNDYFVLITHPSHQLAHDGEVKLSALAGQKVIGLEPGGRYRAAIDRILQENIKIEPVMKFDNIETVKQAVEIGAGVAVVPQSTVLKEVEQGSLVAMQFKGPKFIRPLAILHRKGRMLMPEMKKFIEMLCTTDLSIELKI